ncbi:MAG: S8 family serine peptidase [Planctomycetes bacterium]|nr:S8 family serine peptidase [Planctomycetota bacterium]
MQRPALFSLALAAPLLTLPWLAPLAPAVAPPALAQEGERLPRFVAIPGSREFSGRMIARPRTVAEWIARGSSVAQAQAASDAARRTLERFPASRYVPQTDEYLFALPAGRSENELAEQLLATGGFRYVEPDWTVFPIGCPDDANLASQWHHDPDRMDSCAGWDYGTGDPSIVVGYCDTGLLVTHEDLQLHRVEAYNAVDDQWESAGGAVDAIHPHGTWVTGCGSGNGDNAIGIAGVGWNLGHRMLRVTNSTGGSASLSTLQHAARTSIENGDKVASVSYSGVDSSSNLSTASYVKSIGGLMVWAAGNDSRNLTFGDRDADDLIVAGGTDETDSLSYFSAYGIFVDVTAPASNIYTTGPDANNDYDVVSGTSFATPLTAGLCALIWSQDPTLTPDEVESILKSGCEDLGTTGLDSTFGYGRIDVVGALVQLALQLDTPNGLPSTVQLTGGTTVDLVAVGSGGVTAVAGSGLLHLDDGTGWRTVALADGAPGAFTATFPGLPGAECGDPIGYYFTVVGSDGRTYANPAGAPAAFHTASGDHPGYSESTLVALDFESAAGWTVSDVNLTDGSWNRGVPVDDDRYDPPTDFDGSGQCFLTDNTAGNSDVDGGPTRLLSPLYDLRGFQEVTLSYARWFHNNNSDGDRLDVEVSADGGATWTLLESVSDSGQWNTASFDLRGVVPFTSQFQVRFSATDNPNDSITEAAIDAFQLVSKVLPLKFDITPQTVALQDPIEVNLWTGSANAPLLILLVDLDGVPVAVPMVLTTFDANGRFAVSDSIPNDPTLVDLDLTFSAFGFDLGGKLRATNAQLLQIR